MYYLRAQVLGPSWRANLFAGMPAIECFAAHRVLERKTSVPRDFFELQALWGAFSANAWRRTANLLFSGMQENPRVGICASKSSVPTHNLPLLWQIIFPLCGISGLNEKAHMLSGLCQEADN